MITSIEKLLIAITNAPLRYHELAKKRKEQGLTPREEGEMCGLLVFPNHARGRELLIKVYDAQACGEQMLSEETVELQRALAEPWRKDLETMWTEDILKDMELYFASGTNEKPIYPTIYPTISPQSSPRLYQEYLSLWITMAKVAAKNNGWFEKPINAEVIEQVVSRMPDKPIIFKTNARVPIKNEPSEIELLMLSQLSQISVGDDPYNLGDDPYKTDGTLTVLESILCLRDQVRTKRFLLAIKDAVKKLEKKSEIVYVLDAGCGAIPMLGIYATLCSNKVKCTLLELNPNSYRIAREFIGKFNLEDRVRIFQQDATTYVHDEKPNLLISETMHSGLIQEPMVQIMSNLFPYVVPNGIVLPSKVKIKAALVRVTEVMDCPYTVGIWPYLIPKWQEVLDYKPGDKLEKIDFKLSTTDLVPGLYLVLVTSDVDLDSEHLVDYESLLTTPQVVLDKSTIYSDLNSWLVTLKPSDIGLKSVHISYRPGDLLEQVGRFE